MWLKNIFILKKGSFQEDFILSFILFFTQVKEKSKHEKEFRDHLVTY